MFPQVRTKSEKLQCYDYRLLYIVIHRHTAANVVESKARFDFTTSIANHQQQPSYLTVDSTQALGLRKY